MRAEITLQQRKHSAVSEIQIRFNGATGAASSGSVKGGECAWTDRSWGEDDPTLLYLSVPLEKFQFAVDSDKNVWITKTRRTGPLTSTPNADDIQELANAVLNRERFKVYARVERRDNRQVLRITRLAP